MTARSMWILFGVSLGVFVVAFLLGTLFGR